MVRETSSRDRYRKLKRDITAKLTYQRLVLPAAAGVASYRAALTKAALLPLTAVALPTIRESSDVAAARRKLSDPLAPRTSGKSPVPAASRASRSVRPMSSLRPCLSALPIRSWNSDDSDLVGTANDVPCRSGDTAKRARLCRNDHVDESVVAPSSIPIVISSPDDCVSLLASAANKSTELLSAAPRRSSCPFPVYDVTCTADSDENTTTSGSPRDLTTSRKRRHDFALSVTTHRRPSLQSVTVAEARPAASGRAAQKSDGSVRQIAAAAAAAAPAERGGARYQQSSSLDVRWSTRRLSLPPSSASLSEERLTDRLQLPAAMP